MNIYTVGDISFCGKLGRMPSKDIFMLVHNIFDNADLVLGNLENPLTEVDKPIPGKCTMRGDLGWALVMKEVGFSLVSLANNHMMDYGPEGLFNTIEALESAGIKHVGAGMNVEEANAPIIITIKERNIAFFARSSVIVTSPAYAGPTTPGVAFLDTDELKDSIAQSRKVADQVIVLLHWGVEEYAYPAPAQIDLARQLIVAGADVLIGHHPHVLQGMHRIENGLVAYSLGNFLFDDFLWNMGEAGKDTLITLSESNRKGIILQMSWDRTGLADVSRVFTRINSRGIIIDDDLERGEEFERLSIPLDRALYKSWWRCYAIWREWNLRVRTIISPSRIMKNLWKIRPRHIAELIRTIKKSSNIALGKSTNPYE